MAHLAHASMLATCSQSLGLPLALATGLLPPCPLCRSPSRPLPPPLPGPCKEVLRLPLAGPHHLPNSQDPGSVPGGLCKGCLATPGGCRPRVGIHLLNDCLYRAPRAAYLLPLSLCRCHLLPGQVPHSQLGTDFQPSVCPALASPGGHLGFVLWGAGSVALALWSGAPC